MRPSNRLRGDGTRSGHDDRHRHPGPVDPVDAWAPPVDFGYWRTLYAECCDAVLAYDRVVATMAPGPLRESLAATRSELVASLAAAGRLAELATVLFPWGPRRDPQLLALLADDPVQDLTGKLADQPPDPGLRAALVVIREEMWGVADDAARVAVRVCENPNATDLSTWLRGMADGVAAARRAGWVAGQDVLDDAP